MRWILIFSDHQKAGRQHRGPQFDEVRAYEEERDGHFDRRPTETDRAQGKSKEGERQEKQQWFQKRTVVEFYAKIASRGIAPWLRVPRPTTGEL